MTKEKIKNIMANYWDMEHPEADDFVDELLEYATQSSQNDKITIEAHEETIQHLKDLINESGQERYDKAKKMLNNPNSNTLPLNMVLDAIWLAAYGGCVFCKSGTIQQVGNMYACENCRKMVK